MSVWSACAYSIVEYVAIRERRRHDILDEASLTANLGKCKGRRRSRKGNHDPLYLQSTHAPHSNHFNEAHPLKTCHEAEELKHDTAAMR